MKKALDKVRWLARAGVCVCVSVCVQAVDANNACMRTCG
jgi:hypothetical protein